MYYSCDILFITCYFTCHLLLSIHNILTCVLYLCIHYLMYNYVIGFTYNIMLILQNFVHTYKVNFAKVSSSN